MPVKRDSCDSCGEHKVKCPECNDRKVTVQERHGYKSANNIVNFGGEGKYTWKHVCWNCGWTEMVTAEITREVTE